MDTVAFQKVTTSATDITKSVVAGQAEIFDIYAKNSEGTPLSSFFNAAATMQRAALQGLENLSETLTTAPANAQAKGVSSTTKSLADSASAPLEAAAKVVKKAVDAQADALVEASAATIVATSQTQDALAKATTSAAQGDLTAAYDDLTVVSGIGPSTMKKLQSQGIRTISDLAKTSNKQLTIIVESAKIRMLKNTPSDWIGEAKQLLKSAKAA